MPAARCAGSSTVALNTRAVDAIAPVATATITSETAAQARVDVLILLERTIHRPYVSPPRQLLHSTPRRMDPETIEIRPLAGPDELLACVDLQCETWGEGFSDVVPAAILKVAQRIGGIVLGAFAPPKTLVGFVFGLTGVERGRLVHWSDMLAVRPEARNIGIGRRLKEEQRRVVRELGADVIYWTFDPLVGRNAHLNLNRLGVRISEYVVDMYGITDSVLHGGVPTDRLIVAWPTHDDEIAERLAESE